MLFLVLLALAPCLWLVEAKCYHGYQSAYSFDVGSRFHSSWMGAIPDQTNLTSLSIPGTHDSLTYDVRDPVFQCQNRNLSTQLRSGLRYFDVRAKLNDNSLLIYHGSVFTGYSYTDVLLTLFGFLEENPSETIVMRLKDEGQPLGTTNITFEDAFNYYYWNSTLTAKGSQQHFFLPEVFTPLPTLGALRGKIFILQNFRADEIYGMIWESSDMVLQDLWEIPSVNDLDLKWDAIKSGLERAATAPDDNAALHLGHLSASVGLLPIEAAAGPLNRTVVGMNDRTGEWLAEEVVEGDPKYGKTGIVIIDFPGQRLIDAVLERNAGLTV